MGRSPIDVSAILLAAGASRRFGAADKLLAEIDGIPLVARVAARLCSADLSDVIAVTVPPPAGDAVMATLSPFPLRIVHNAEHERGIGTSITCGVAAAPATSGLMIVPGDMPALDANLLAQLLATFRRCGGTRIVVPVNAAGEQRNPVVWPASLRAALLALQAEAGGKTLLAANSDHILKVQWNDEAAFEDIDTEAELSAFRAAPAQVARSKP